MLFGFDVHHFFTARYAKWLVISLVIFFSLLIVLQWSKLLITHEVDLPKEKEIDKKT